MEIPPRKNLIRRLQAALAPPCAPPIYLHGPPSTAKQSTLRCAAPLGATITPIDCILNHTDRLLFSSITSSFPSSPDQQSTADIPTLLNYLRSFSSESTTTTTSSSSSPRHILLFTRAERLATSSFPSSTLILLFQLPVLSQRNDLRIVFSSLIPFSTLRHTYSNPLPSPTSIFFPPLSQEELVTTLYISFDESDENTKKIYKKFSASVVDILYRTSNNPLHLQRVTESLFPDYLTELMDHSPLAAFNRVRDRLAKTLSSTSAISLNQQQQQNENTDKDKEKMITLPKAARVLLIACFLGCAIAPTHDMRHFSTERTGRRSSAVQKLNTNASVPLERLLAIYAAVLPDDLELITEQEKESYGSSAVSECISTAAMIHLSTLVALGWLSRDSGNVHDRISEPKFKCRVPRDEIMRVASSIDMNIHDYLVTH